jgi:thiol-disulfide isomerase/thioredoxin
VNLRLPGWIREFRVEIRWTIVAVVLVALAIVALWPRGPQRETAAPEGGALSAPPSQSVDPALRASAGLLPCPSSTGGPSRTSLATAEGTCLASGAPANLGAAVDGRPTLINVWAAWCAPCRTELPALQAYSRRPGAIQVVGVLVQSDQSSGLMLLKQLGVVFPTIWDGDGQIASALRVPNALPASFIVTADGSVRPIEPPVVFGSADQVSATVRRTLGVTGE